VLAVGVDAEPNEPLPDGVLNGVSLPPERDAIAELSRSFPWVCWQRLLFSAKEAVYKAWFPLTWRWLDFDEVCVRFEPDAGTFTARFLVDGPEVAGHGRLTELSGRWIANDALVVTAIVLPRPGSRVP
jgi:4'-phosphopantetheinyl transferase EntD